jgi:glycosyltransferase involved in cell wall biosynthesis
MLRLVRELNRQGHSVYLLCLSEVDSSHYQEKLDDVRRLCTNYLVIQRPKLNFALKVFRFLTSRTPTHAVNLVSKEAAGYIRDITSAGKIDVTVFVSTAMGEYVRCVERSKSALVFIDLELEARRLALVLQNCADPMRRVHSRISWLRESIYEKSLLSRVDLNIAITEQEQAYMQQIAPSAQIQVIPPMIDLEEYRLHSVATTPVIAPSIAKESIVFVGSFTHQPNIDAMRWFCTEVFPLISSQYPSAHLYIVGSQAQKAIPELAGTHISIISDVVDVKPWLAGAAVVISPIRSGGGARLKNLEALAMARALVTTSLGSEGLGELPGSSYLTADTPVAFATHVVALLADPSYRQNIGDEGYKMLQRYHSTTVVGEQIERLLRLCVSHKTIGQGTLS